MYFYHNGAFMVNIKVKPFVYLTTKVSIKSIFFIKLAIECRDHKMVLQQIEIQHQNL